MQIRKKSKPTAQRQTSQDPITGTEIRTDFAFQERPKFTDTLRFPDDITQLTATNISELLGKYTKLYVYANQNLAKANVALLRLDTRESLLRNAIFRSRPSLNGLDRWRRDAIISEHPEMESIIKHRGHHLQQKELLTTLVANFDKYLVALSRELSRKSFDRETTRPGF